MKQIPQFALLLLCLLSFPQPTLAQTEDQVRDLQKLYQTAAAPGLEVTVYLQQKNGTLVPVDPQQEFHQGERVKIRIEGNFRGELYLINHAASGKRLVFPEKTELNSTQNDATARTYEFVFDETAGFETLQVIATQKPLPFLEAALKQKDGKLTKSQATAAARYWDKQTPKQAGIAIISTSKTKGPKDRGGMPDIAFNKKTGTTTVITGSKKGTAKQPPSPPPSSVAVRFPKPAKK